LKQLDRIEWATTVAPILRHCMSDAMVAMSSTVVAAFGFQDDVIAFAAISSTAEMRNGKVIVVVLVWRNEEELISAKLFPSNSLITEKNLRLFLRKSTIGIWK